MKRHKTVHEYLEEQSEQRISLAPSSLSESLPEIVIDSPQQANEAHYRVVGHAQKLLLEVIAIGRYLTRVKAELGHGNWENWVRDNLDFASNTAWRYMKVYEKQDLLKAHDLHTLELNEAYKLLAGKKTNPTVRAPGSKSKLLDKDGQQKRLSRFAHQAGITLDLGWPIKALDPINRKDPIEAALQLLFASLKQNTTADRKTLLDAIVQAAQRMQADQTEFEHDLVQLYAEENEQEMNRTKRTNKAAALAPDLPVKSPGSPPEVSWSPNKVGRATRKQTRPVTAPVLMLAVFLSLGNSQAHEPIIIDQDSGEILNGNFDAGWEAGWCAGYKHIKGDYAFVPLTPLSPLPPLGKDNFEGGYNLGFLAGIAKARGR